MKVHGLTEYKLTDLDWELLVEGASRSTGCVRSGVVDVDVYRRVTPRRKSSPKCTSAAWNRQCDAPAI
jgi:hypothetical protein